MVTQKNSNAVSIEPTIVGFSTNISRADHTCKTCKWEDDKMQCRHPDNGKASFRGIDMKDCYDYNKNSKSLGQKAKDKYEGRK